MTTSTGVKAPTTPGTSQSTLSEWAGPYVVDMLGKAQALSERPYETYQGPVVADTSALQNKYFSGLGSLTFPQNLGQTFSSSQAPTLPSATAGSPTSSTGPTGIAAQYMNPYLNAVLTPQLDELRRQAGITQQGLAGKAAQAGAFGGTRYGLQEAENQRNLMQEMNKTIGTGYANAYDKAMQQFNAEQGQAKTLADMIGAAGTQQRAIEQEGLTADYNEFLTQRDYPTKQVQFLQSMLQNLPISSVTTTQAPQSTLGEINSILGGLGTAYDLLKKIGVL